MPKLLEFLTAWIVGVVLAVSAFAHLAEPYHFLDAVMQYGLLPGTLAKLVAVFAPFFQLVLAFCLISGIMRDAAYYLALLLFLGFAFVQSYAWFAGLGIPCGCFGANDTPIGWFSLSIVYGTLALTALRILFHAKRKKQSTKTAPAVATVLALILLVPSLGTAQELQESTLTFPPDSREESARVATAALFQEFAIDAEASHFGTPKEIADALTAHGLHIRYFTGGTLGDLQKRAGDASPSVGGVVLLQWKTDWSSRSSTRWVLLREIQDNRATVVDPTISVDEPTTISTAELLARWNGVGMVVSQEEIAANVPYLKYLPLGLFLFGAYLVWELRKITPPKVGNNYPQYATIVLATLLLGGTYHLATPTGLLRNPVAAEIVTERFTQHVPELTLAETKERLKQGKALFFDTREAEKFAEGTIDGAVSFPINSTLTEREILLADVPQQIPIILFCSSNRCLYADDIAQFLRHNGYENVAIYREGIVGWNQ